MEKRLEKRMGKSSHPKSYLEKAGGWITGGETAGKIDWRNGGSQRKNCFLRVILGWLHIVLQLVSLGGETVGETV